MGTKHVSGILQVTRKAVGYLAFPIEAGVKKTLEDIEVAPEHLGGALNGDTVSVEIIGTSPRTSGKVVKVESRAKTEFVGTLKHINDQWVVLASDIKFYRPIHIEHLLEGAVAGSKVLVELVSFDGKTDPKGKITDIIGIAGEHRAEMNAIVLEHGFKTEFPANVVAEAQKSKKSTPQSSQAKFQNVPTFATSQL